MKSTVAVLFALTIAYAQESASVLARILANKGTISASELARVESAAPADRVSLLTDLLRQKGVLDASEVARITAPAAATANSAQSTAATNGSSQTPRTAAPAPPVISQRHFPVTLYGTILVNSVYDTALMNITDIPLFTAKQGSDALGNDKAFAMTARQTRLGFLYDSPSDVLGASVHGQVEVDFLGGKAPFGNGANFDLLRLRLAFGRMDWKNFSLEGGQDWSIFAPLNPTSLAEYAIPSLSAAGNLWIRMPQIRGEIRSKLGRNTSLLTQFAAIDPDMGDYNTTVFSATRAPGIGERGRAPGAEGRFALTGKRDDRDFTIGFSGHYAHGKNSGTVGNLVEQLPVESWGGAIDYSLPFSKKFNVTGELYTGNALGIFSSESGEAISAPGVLGDRGVRASGGWMQAQVNFTPKWQMNLAYGIDDPVAHDLAIGSRTRNQNYMGNVIYKPVSHVNIAWEYRRILTDFRNQLSANERGDVANLALAYFF